MCHRQTDGWTDGRTDWTIHRADWSQLKIEICVIELYIYIRFRDISMSLLSEFGFEWSRHLLVINLLMPSDAYMCVGKLSITGSDNGLSPDRHQAIIWTNVGILLIGPLGTNFSEILIEIQTFSFKKMHLKMSSAKWRSFCLGLNVLTKIWPHVRYSAHPHWLHFSTNCVICFLR